MEDSPGTTQPGGSKTPARREREKKSALQQAIFEQGKVPPQAVDLEEAVLGAIMLEKDALSTVIDILTPEVFYKEQHRIIFKAIHRLFAKTEPVDILTVTNELKNSGDLEIAGGAYYITQLTNRVASTANVEFHSRIILQKHIQRELIRISSEIIKDSFEDTTDVFELLDSAEQQLFNISENSLRRNYLDMQTLIREAIKEIEAAKGHEDHLRGVPSGFTGIDRITSGWQKSDLIILASRPGMGKTAFALSMARNIALDFQKPVAVFSLEMSSVQLVTRLISAESDLTAEKLRKGDLQDYEWQQLNTKIKRLIDSPIYIDDTPALSIFELRAKCRRLKAQHDVQIIFVDYLQLMTSPSEGKGNREQEISNISRSLKALAKELNVPILALSQLSRAVETRGGSKKPILSDLRESGAIEQDADLVLFIYRPEYYKIDVDEEGNSTSGLAEISIAKHRNGALADIKLRFVSQFARFIDQDKDMFGTDDFQEESNENGNMRTVRSRMDEIEDDEEEETPF
jgi:replicative DNA helicase